MILTHISETLVFFLLIVETALATVTTRYTIPIPAGILILETRQQLNDMAAAYSMGTLDDRNGGYYLLDQDGEILAVAADDLCEELDISMASARRVYEQRSRFDLYSGEVQEVTLQSHDAQLRRSDGNSFTIGVTDDGGFVGIAVRFMKVRWRVLYWIGLGYQHAVKPLPFT